MPHSWPWETPPYGNIRAKRGWLSEHFVEIMAGAMASAALGLYCWDLWHEPVPRCIRNSSGACIESQTPVPGKARAYNTHSYDWPPEFWGETEKETEKPRIYGKDRVYYWPAEE